MPQQIQITLSRDTLAAAFCSLISSVEGLKSLRRSAGPTDHATLKNLDDLIAGRELAIAEVRAALPDTL